MQYNTVLRHSLKDTTKHTDCRLNAMDTKWMNIDFHKGLYEVGVNVESASEADSSFDFYEDIERDVSAIIRTAVETKSLIYNFDLCKEEFDGVDSYYTAENMKIFKAASSGVVSELDSDDVKSSVSAESTETMDFENFYNGQFGEMSYPVASCQESVHMTDQEFEEMQLRDIVKEHALPFLPAKSLTRFRSVSRAWDSWIKSPFLAHKQSYTFQNMSGYFHQHNISSLSFVSLCTPAYGIPSPSLRFLPEKALSIMSSSNGLLLCRTTKGDITYYICNPVTKKWKVLPQPSYYHGEDPAIVLAFDPSVLNMESSYQLVCAFPIEPVFCFEIYSSVTNTWESTDAFCAELKDVRLKNNGGFYFNGVAYWETTSNEVLAFDLKSETHTVFSLPSDVPGGGALSHIEGELCFVTAHRFDGSLFEVSFYMGIDDMKLKKCVYFDLETESDDSCRVLPCLGNEFMMLLVDGCTYACNMIDQKVEMVKRDGNMDLEGKYLPYVNSLVSVA